jgi:hypothetical protein
MLLSYYYCYYCCYCHHRLVGELLVDIIVMNIVLRTGLILRCMIHDASACANNNYCLMPASRIGTRREDMRGM